MRTDDNGSGDKREEEHEEKQPYIYFLYSTLLTMVEAALEASNVEMLPGSVIQCRRVPASAFGQSDMEMLLRYEP